jgi:hypothetical protein
MKTSRIALVAFAAIVGIGALAGSAHHSPAHAGGLDWLGNKKYVQCLQAMNFLAKYNGGRPQSAAGAEAAYDRGRRWCNKEHYPNRPGTQY